MSIEDEPRQRSGMVRHPSAATSRRAWVALGAYAAAAVTLGRGTRAAPSSTQLGPLTNTRRFPVGELRFLVDRVTNGWTPAEWARAQALGYGGYLREQLDPAAIVENPTLVTLLAGLGTLNLDAKPLYDTYFAPSAPQSSAIPINELELAAVLRGALSKRQLFERMVEFWTDHFNVTHDDGQVRWLKTVEDREVMRVHALGNFRDLLAADAKSAAMLYYLDNYRNFATAPNENYARELMELHTLGVGNYTETDVREVARCFTGWQYWPTNVANHGDFRFNPAQHDNGAKIVLGVSIPAGGGIQDGETVLTILANHPATARFIARKLLRWFVGYAPPQSAIDRVANVFLTSGGDLKAVVRTVLEPVTVNLIPVTARAKIRRPFHLACSLLRATNPVVTTLSGYLTELFNMGHRPMRWPAPNGYPDAAEVWGQSVLARWNFVSRFSTNSIAGATWSPAAVFGSTPKSQLAARAAEVLLGGVIAPEDLAAVQNYANAASTLNDTLRRDVLALTAQSPSFQYF